MKSVHPIVISLVLIAAFGAGTVACARTIASGSSSQSASASATHDSAINWQPWSDQVFAKAKQEHRFVLLDLEAIWCHWCHVMDQKTYKDPGVAELLSKHFIAVKVDQDSRPDLSGRYEDYGWPATIIFDSSGKEIVKRSGYIEPKGMATLLQAIAKDPARVMASETGSSKVKENKQSSESKTFLLSPTQEKELIRKHKSGFDNKVGGWGTFQKFLDADSVEYSLMLASRGDTEAERRAHQTLAGELALVDPVWGGVYQYSTQGDWNHPHFEKIMLMQTDNMRTYAEAYKIWHDSQYLKAAKNIARYLTDFLTSPDGAFYTSQDADLIRGEHSAGYFALNDAGRRKLGMPNIDKHIYARENGMAINAFVALYQATADKQYLDQAIKATNWILANRAIAGGGFRHDEHDDAGPYLGDNLQMERALLSLYQATADRRWLMLAEETANFISRNFVSDSGIVESSTNNKTSLPPTATIDNNVLTARFANLLYHYSGNKEYKNLAERSLRYLANDQTLAKRKYLVAGILLANMELAKDPDHITIVGQKDDPKAKALFEAALAYPSTYKRVEWYDNREGPLPNMDVEYPELPKAAAFGCANQRCSTPAYEPDEVKQVADRFNRPDDIK